MRCLTNLAATTDIATLAANDLGAGRLFLAAADRGDADRFARDTLGPLLDAEDPKVADLLSTLQVFFEAARSVRQTAVRLAVHENTIRYRLSRVAELTGLDVAGNAEHQLAIQVALARSCGSSGVCRRATSPYRRSPDRIRRILVDPPNADADDPTREH